jgi:hypothetical protein
VVLGYTARRLGYYEWNGASWTKTTISTNSTIDNRAIAIRPSGQPFVAAREVSLGLIIWQRGVQP